VATIREAVAHYTTPEFNTSEGASFSGPIQMTEAEIDDVTDFLTALTTCGNGLTSDGDLCDDGNRALGDGCRPNCTVERCGDGILDPGERCDRGVVPPDGACTTPCAP
jgi:cysteine-rich repeat protein